MTSITPASTITDARALRFSLVSSSCPSIVTGSNRHANTYCRHKLRLYKTMLRYSYMCDSK